MEEELGAGGAGREWSRRWGLSEIMQFNPDVLAGLAIAPDVHF